MCGKSLFLPVLALASVVVATVGGFCQEKPHAAASGSVVSVTQLTHDGVGKTGLLADDANLYVTEWPAGRHVLVHFSVPGAERSAIPTNFSNVEAVDWSADHGSLLVMPIQGAGYENEFWTLPVRAGTPHKIGDLSGRDAGWSSDGKKLIFGKDATVYVANSDGTDARAIFTAEGSIFGPRLSPDGTRIRFTVSSVAQNTTEIWEVGSDGGNAHALLGSWQGASRACCGSWSADGRYYIFQVTQTAPTPVTTLWALPAGGAEPMQLTRGPMSLGNASFSQDGKKIFAIGVEPAAQPVKFDAAKNEFVTILGGASATDIDFSADGKWATYVSVPDGALWRSRADGTQRKQLTFASERTALPHWSPDGKQIAYVSMQPGKRWKISLVSPEGGKPYDMLVENRGQIDINWSHVGNSIMFGSVYGEGVYNIREVNLKTKEVTVLAGSDGLFSPRWSPDGRYVAALSLDFTVLMLYDYQAQTWSKWLTEPAGAVNYPIWSADSQRIYFDDLVTEEESIRSIKVGETQTERVFRLEGIERYPGPFGLWSGRMADGSWIFVRDRSTQEVYELGVVLP